jgi:hypothetical protein
VAAQLAQFPSCDDGFLIADSAGSVVIGVLVALIVVATIVGGVFCYARKGKLFEHKTLTESVSFENPSYLRDGDVSNNQVKSPSSSSTWFLFIHLYLQLILI